MTHKKLEKKKKKKSHQALVNPFLYLFSMTTIGQTQPFHNQTSRFANVTELVKYACIDMALGKTTPTRKDINLPQFAIVPPCAFPYINKGWDMDGEPGYEDVVFNDCSILIADSLPGYEAQCTTFVIIALIPVFVSFMFLKTIDSNKKKSDKQKLWYLPGVKGKLNLVERLIRINIVVGIAHALRCIDFCGYSGILDLSTSHTFFTGICVAGPMHTIFLLATSWVTIVDGGKSKKTPKWAKICFEVAKYSIYISEIFLGLAEMNTPAVADYAGAQDGRPR